ncbi:Metallophosphoesterase domain protein [Cordyceps fumosorosea ARSEF 2679]|uniref:Metallophosphoesterase domain protein n=1 Tax=Cordyceps fumosorosea (strain ARSEF 2679) TaxID=1081104 RepID=A0A167Y9Q8_CORFA|nr:Metallophosphoesterase domain protein [Cordyceps fumosorosea ARSEF 2679]OAA66029.1 Metallophosphoesterase domain protein [Cordyceps fumosorosea ARSEF 2679]
MGQAPSSPNSLCTESTRLMQSQTPPTKKPAGRLYAIADLHLSFADNRTAWSRLTPHPGDGLILCGDVGESADHLRLACSKATECFDAVWWCPGNHELYTLPSAGPSGPRGEQKYRECVEVAREYNVLTPEDDFAVWEGRGGPAVVAPVFTLYDYSFRPDGVSLEGAVAWAREADTEATDEFLLHPDPHPSRQAWCAALVERFAAKLAAANARFPTLPLVVANHWPLREDLVALRLIPRFSLWCGTRLTDDWHRRFGAKVVVSGHLHIRRTDWRDGCRFEEVSLGYPRQWKRCAEMGMGVEELLREILPGPEGVKMGEVPTQWRIYG